MRRWRTKSPAALPRGPEQPYLCWVGSTRVVAELGWVVVVVDDVGTVVVVARLNVAALLPAEGLSAPPDSSCGTAGCRLG